MKRVRFCQGTGEHLSSSRNPGRDSEPGWEGPQIQRSLGAACGSLGDHRQPGSPGQIPTTPTEGRLSALPGGPHFLKWLQPAKSPWTDTLSGGTSVSVSSLDCGPHLLLGNLTGSEPSTSTETRTSRPMNLELGWLRISL